MADQDLTDQELFDTSDVTWEVVKSKRRDQITLILKTEGSFSIMKTYLALQMICEKIELEMNIMKSEGEH